MQASIKAITKTVSNVNSMEQSPSKAIEGLVHISGAADKACIRRKDRRYRSARFTTSHPLGAKQELDGWAVPRELLKDRALEG